MNDRRKQTILLPVDYCEEIAAEAKRQGRGMSQIVQFAWEVSKYRVRRMAGPDDVPAIR